MMRRFVALLTLWASLPFIEGAIGVYEIGKIRPEGIHVLPPEASETMGLGEGLFALVSEFYYGGIKAVNLETGNVTQIVNSTSFGERGTIGLWYEDGLILAASGGEFVGENATAALLVFDAVTGDLLAECLPEVEGKFMNDVTVISGLAYVTDSFQNSIMVLELESAASGQCVVSAIETPAEIFLGGDVWSANGIAPFGNGLLIAHETFGAVYYLDLSDDNTVSEVIPNGTLPFSDGLCISDDTLYVAQNNPEGPITGWVLNLMDDGSIKAGKLGSLESPDYDSPATCGIAGEIIYSPNARFGIGLPADGEDDLATFSEMFQVVGVDRFDFAASGTTPTPAPNTTDPTSAAVTIVQSCTGALLVSVVALLFLSCA